MINSNRRKLILSGWLQKNHVTAYYSPLRLQKFLFLYESFSKNDGNESDFSRLKGYQRGPVFSTVWGDYTKERTEFDKISANMYEAYGETIDLLRALRASFIVSSLTEGELSALTHQFNIWKSKRNRIMSGEQQVELEEKDFNANDYSLVCSLEQMFPENTIQNCDIVNIGNKYFVFSKEDIKHFTEGYSDILASLSEQDDLHNPVYVEIGSDGRLYID